MNTTAKQFQILDNLEKVELSPYTPRGTTPDIRRYELDGADCTQHVKSLVVGKCVIMHADGRLERHGDIVDKTGRQLPSAETLQLLRSTLMAVSSVHRDPQSASARARRGG